LLNSYFILKRLSLCDEKAFGIDKSDVLIEQVPLVYHKAENVDLIRKNTTSEM
jgi:KUP system potassium uptake protein